MAICNDIQERSEIYVIFYILDEINIETNDETNI